MVRGFYSAAAGVMAKQKAIDAISNNITNTSTAGYKSQSTIESSFGEHLVSRMEPSSGAGKRNIGPGSFMTVNAKTYVDHTQGMMENTGRSVDLAIVGEGFFVISNEKHGNLLTRNGQFELDERMDLTLPGIGKVQDENGRNINLKNSDFTVGDDGTIYIEGRTVAKLNIAAGEDLDEMIKIGEGVFIRDTGQTRAGKESFNIVQGFFEKANVNIAKEMSRIIASHGNYQSCTQVLRIYDRLNELTVNRIGSLD